MREVRRSVGELIGDFQHRIPGHEESWGLFLLVPDFKLCLHRVKIETFRFVNHVCKPLH